MTQTETKEQIKIYESELETIWRKFELVNKCYLNQMCVLRALIDGLNERLYCPEG